MTARRARLPEPLCAALAVPPTGALVKVPSPPPRVVEPVDEGLAFRFSNGATARSLVELEGVLRAAPPGVVWFHREHFVPWVRDVLGDEPLARRFEHYAAAHAAPDALKDVLADLVETRVRELRPA